MTNTVSIDDFVRVEDPITGEYLYHQVGEKQARIIWVRWHWEDKNGWVPTRDEEWNYEHCFINVDVDPLEKAKEWFDRRMKSHNDCFFDNRKILYEVIARPPAVICKSQVAEARRIIRDASMALDEANAALRIWNNV